MTNAVSRGRSLVEQWSVLAVHQRFEGVVALALTLVIGVVIVVALVRLGFEGVGSLVFSSLNPLDHEVFQTVFGEIMTLLIALEFNHTLQYVVAREESIIQTKVVLLIALLALAHKVIILNLETTGPGTVFGLAALTLALGMTYWFVRERDARARRARAPPDAATHADR